MTKHQCAFLFLIDRQTDRQTDGETDGETDTDTEWQNKDGGRDSIYT